MDKKVKSKTRFSVKTEKLGEIYVKSDDLNIFEDTSEDEIQYALTYAMAKFDQMLVNIRLNKPSK